MTGTTRQPLRVLFVCTENAARSQIAEALLRSKGADAFDGASAGSHPAAHVHPLATQALAELGIDWSAARPKGFAAVRDQSWDFIITLCDRAREHCPTFPGDPVYAHWSMADPARAEGDEAARRRAFADAVAYLRQRIAFLRLIPTEQLEQAAREHRAQHAPDLRTGGLSEPAQ